MVLDVSLNNQAANSMILYKWNNGANQKFGFRSVGGGKFAMFCSMNNMAIKIPEGNKDNGTQIVCSQANKKENEFWVFIPCVDLKFKGKNAFYIKSFCGKALDVFDGKAKNEQKIIQWEYNGQKNQIWII